MADTTQRKVELIVSATDNASGTLAKVGQNARKMAQQIAAQPPVYGPAVKPRFDANEQSIRDEVAGRTKAMRDAATRARRNEEINRRLYGEPEKAAEQPAAKPARLSAFEQSVRNQQAEQINSMRKQAQNAKVSEEANRRLYGDKGPADESDAIRSFANNLPGRRSGGKGGSGGSGGGPKGPGGGAEDGWYKSLKESGDGLENFTKVIKGVGDLGVVSEIGRSLQKLPDAAEKYYASLRAGATKSEAAAEAFADAIPVIGELAKGFQAAGKFLYDNVDAQGRQKADAARKKEEQQDIKDAIYEKQQKQKIVRDEITNRFRDESKESSRAAALSRLIATDLVKDQARKGAEFERDDALERITKEQNDVQRLAPDKQDAARKQLQQRRLDAEQIYQDKLRELDRQMNEEEESAQRSHAGKLISDRGQNEQKKLELAYKFHEAAIASAQAEYEAEVRAAKATEVEELKVLADKGAAHQRYAETVAEAEKKKTNAIASEAQRQKEIAADLALAQRDHNESIQEANNRIQQDRLRMGGHGREADELAAAEDLRAKLAKIERDKEASVRDATRSGLPESEKDAIRQRAMEEAGIAQEEFDDATLRMKQERDARNRPSAPNVNRGDSRLLGYEQYGFMGSQAASKPADKVEQAAKDQKALLEKINTGIATLNAAIAAAPQFAVVR
jgi:hypothetical protein